MSFRTALCGCPRACYMLESALQFRCLPTHSRSKAARMAAVSAASCAGSRYPIRSPSVVFGIVTILSQFTTESWPRPLAWPTGISTDRPRAADVSGATVICVRSGMTTSRVSTRTGRALSRRAIWIGLTDPGPRDARRGIARDQPYRRPRLIWRRWQRHGRPSRDDADLRKVSLGRTSVAPRDSTSRMKHRNHPLPGVGPARATPGEPLIGARRTRPAMR